MYFSVLITEGIRNDWDIDLIEFSLFITVSAFSEKINTIALFARQIPKGE